MNRKISTLWIIVGLLSSLVWSQTWRGSETVAIQVDDAKGRAVPGARVAFTFQGVPEDIGPDIVATDSKGKAVVADLAPGPWQVEVFHPDYLSFIAMLDVRRGKKPLISASFLEAGGRSLNPIKVKFSKGDPRQASPVFEARATPPPTETDSTVAAEPEPATTQVAEVAPPAPSPAVDAPIEPVAEVAPPAPPPAVDEPIESVAEEVEAEPEPQPEPSLSEPTLPEPTPEVTETEIASVDVEAAPETAPEPAADDRAATTPAAEAPAAGAVAAAAAAASPTNDSDPDATGSEEIEVPETEIGAAPASDPVPMPTAETPQPEEIAPSLQEPAEVPQPEVQPVTPEPPTPDVATAPDSAELVEERPVAAPPAEEPERVQEALPEAAEVEPPPSPEEVSPAPPAVAAAAAAAPPDPGIRVTSHRDGSCADCQTAEWTLQVSAEVPAVSAESRGTCDIGVLAAAQPVMRELSASIQLELQGFIGPLANGTAQEAIRRAESDMVVPFQGPLAAFVGGVSPCQIVGLVLPREVRFSRVAYGAADQEGSGACVPGKDCTIGDAAWLGSARVERGPSSTVVYGLFENRSSSKGRRAFLTAFYRPPSARWQPRLPAAD